jgi:hypothetical protein
MKFWLYLAGIWYGYAMTSDFGKPAFWLHAICAAIVFGMLIFDVISD